MVRVSHTMKRNIMENKSRKANAKLNYLEYLVADILERVFEKTADENWRLEMRPILCCMLPGVVTIAVIMRQEMK